MESLNSNLVVPRFSPRMAPTPKRAPMSKDDRKQGGISEQDQMDIIEQTGVMKLVSQNEESNLLASVLLSLPLTILHITFEYLVHVQYGITDQFHFEPSKHLALFPAILAFTFVTNVFKSTKFGQFLFLVVAVGVGSYVIHLTIDEGTYGALSKTPGLITIGILLIIQANLSLALLSVICWTMFYYREVIYQYIPNGSMPSLKDDL